jgi:hypothetical protein
MYSTYIETSASLADYSRIQLLSFLYKVLHVRFARLKSSRGQCGNSITLVAICLKVNRIMNFKP